VRAEAVSTPTERVRGVSGVVASLQVHYALTYRVGVIATAWVTKWRLVKSGRGELAPDAYASGISHPFSLQLTASFN